MATRAVILDVDGTLVDSNDAHAQAWVDALAELGRPIVFERVRPLIGMGGDKVLPELTGLSQDSPEGKRLGERRAEIFQRRFLPVLKPLPGARPLLERMRAQGLTLVVASSAQEDELKVLLEIAGASDLVQETTSGSDADRSKPDPDIVRVALEGAGSPAAETLMIGDTRYDIEAAAKVGVRTVAFRSGGWQDADLPGALAIYDGPADLLARYDESPLAGR